MYPIRTADANGSINDDFNGSFNGFVFVEAVVFIWYYAATSNACIR